VRGVGRERPEAPEDAAAEFDFPKGYTQMALDDRKMMVVAKRGAAVGAPSMGTSRCGPGSNVAPTMSSKHEHGRMANGGHLRLLESSSPMPESTPAKVRATACVSGSTLTGCDSSELSARCPRLCQ
jgi:hypothetical protein